MAPEYSGKVNILVVIDHEDWNIFVKYKILTIPTQLFFN